METNNFFKIEDGILTTLPFIDMGLILHSISELDTAYKDLQENGFSKFILLHAENDQESGPHFNLPHLTHKYPGIIPALSPVKNEVFQNLPHIHGLFKTYEGKGVLYQHPVTTSLHIAIAYQVMTKAKDLNALYISFPYNKNLSSGGVMHEGEISFKHGLPGISRLAEEAVVARDIELAQAIGNRLHFHQVSTERSIELVRRAKEEGIQVTCGVSAGHLLYTHQECRNFNPNYKYLPPLREEDDRAALIDGIKNGIVDTISTGHYAGNSVEKLFLKAPATSLAINRIFPLLYKKLVCTDTLSLETLLNLLSIAPRQILDLSFEDRKISFHLEEQLL